ncbi:hypothetical protein JXA80_14085 [bacterium]|nr:hypothetical protein [candidate division CSSED10-310 bacterium]
MANGKLKSAYELAMERLAGSNPGMVEAVLSDSDKARIAEIRREYDAKIAEREIMYRSRLAEMLAAIHPAERALHRETVENDFRNAVAVLKRAMEERIQAIRDRK